MLAAVRRIFRIIMLVFFCLAMMLAAAISRLFAFSRWHRVKLGAFWAHQWSRGAAWIIGVRVRIFGDTVCESGRLVVSNHLGYLDILAHASVFLLRFAPKAEIRRWPFFGWLTALGSPVWIDRKNPRMSVHYAEEFRETMAHGISMLVYPEGTSTDGKHGLLPFKSTPFAAALQSRTTILPTLLFYRERGNQIASAAWFDDTPFGTHIWRTLGMPGVDIDVYILPEVVLSGDEDRKAVAAMVHDLMEKEYWKIEKAR